MVGSSSIAIHRSIVEVLDGSLVAEFLGLGAGVLLGVLFGWPNLDA